MSVNYLGIPYWEVDSEMYREIYSTLKILRVKWEIVEYRNKLKEYQLREIWEISRISVSVKNSRLFWKKLAILFSQMWLFEFFVWPVGFF